MTWFAFHGYPVIDVAGIQEKNLVAWGFHGYATKADALKNPNSVNLLQKPIVNAAEQDYKTALQQGSQPGGPNASNPLGAAASQAANLGGLAAVGDFFNRLTQKNTWLRVGEVVAGLLLVYLGLNAVMRNTAVGNAVQGAKNTAMKAAAVVPK